MSVLTTPEKLTVKDFATDQEVRWCPGCGDYAILKAVQKTLVDIDARPESTVFISGIGCAARFPYYMETYGFHTIHGRAPAFATGVKLANPELDVWVVSGDGDALSIGGNHLIHMLRRNVNLQFLLFNNEIYGLTKGQYSPTSRAGTRSPSTPLGSVDNPISATQLALASGARFVARSIDNQIKHMPVVLARAHAHIGTSFVEIFQNCIVYNDGVFNEFTAKDKVANQQIAVEHGQPLLFGAGRQKGLHIKPKSLEIEVVTIGENGIVEDDILFHDEKNKVLATLLAGMQGPYFPVAIGVLYCDTAPSYEQEVQVVLDKSTSKTGSDLNALLRIGHTWQVDVKS
jgi:2-oxoglutarate ferredoxin oxidoreductase subunit beta